MAAGSAAASIRRAGRLWPRRRTRSGAAESGTIGAMAPTDFAAPAIVAAAAALALAACQTNLAEINERLARLYGEGKPHREAAKDGG